MNTDFTCCTGSIEFGRLDPSCKDCLRYKMHLLMQSAYDPQIAPYFTFPPIQGRICCEFYIRTLKDKDND